MAEQRGQTLSPRQVLLTKAVQCYRAAGHDVDACRCLERLGDYRGAAFLHENARRFSQAAVLYERAELWAAAARCYLQMHAPAQAARCLTEAGDYLEAGWLLAHEAHHFERAQALLTRVEPQSLQDELALALARARCTVVNRRNEAGAIVRRVSTELAQLPPGPGRDRIVRWALELIEVLNRPDLATQLYAAAVAAGLPQALEQWETWAQRRLGTAVGLPAQPTDGASERVNE